jgi:hypothetical protein
MSGEPFVILDNGRETRVIATLGQDGVMVMPDAIHAALGWEQKPEGFCHGAVCVPVPPGSSVVTRLGIDLAAFARLLHRPVAFDVDEKVALLGVSAEERASALTSLEAPDFTLPDLEGRLHSLSEYRGKKVLLVAYASW